MAGDSPESDLKATPWTGLDMSVRVEHLTDVNLNVLIKRLRGGFRPFVLHLTDGRSFSVPHPEFIAVGKHAVVVVDKDGDPVYIDPLHIVSVDEKTNVKNGRSSK